MTQKSVIMSSLYANAIQDEVNTLPNVVAGLRHMDSCLVPWISTAYCYVDFHHKWEMANSAARQARCNKHMKSNGAVYLESILRNVDAEKLKTCFPGLEDAIFKYLNSIVAGRDYVRELASLHVAESASEGHRRLLVTADTPDALSAPKCQAGNMQGAFPVPVVQPAQLRQDAKND
jgi:hypothetical protein